MDITSACNVGLVAGLTVTTIGIIFLVITVVIVIKRKQNRKGTTKYSIHNPVTIYCLSILGVSQYIYMYAINMLTCVYLR